MSLPKSARTWAIWLGLCLFLPLSGVATRATVKRQRRHRIDIENREVVGIFLGKTSATDVNNLLGPAKETKAAEHGVTKKCYISEGADRTVLEIYSWFDPVEFRIFPGTSGSLVLCHPSRLVTASLSTASGLRLGLTRAQVISILGQPTSIRGNDLIYESEYQQPESARQLAQGRQAGLSGSLQGPVDIYDRVEVGFSGSRVAYIDVVHDETI